VSRCRVYIGTGHRRGLYSIVVLCRSPSAIAKGRASLSVEFHTPLANLYCRLGFPEMPPHTHGHGRGAPSYRVFCRGESAMHMEAETPKCGHARWCNSVARSFNFAHKSPIHAYAAII